MRTVYRNASIFEGGRFVTGDLVVDGGRIVSVGGEAADGGADRTVDLGGLHLLPGLVDVHVHLREPGFTQKETIATGTAAAAHGGYTTVCAMPNLNPAPDSPATLGVELAAIGRDARVKVIPYGCITMGQRGAGELVDFAALAPDVVGFSDDGRGVQSEALMEEAMRRAAAVRKPIVAHCEVDDLLRGGYIHDGEYCREHGHRGISSESEWRQVERDIALAERTGCQYHVCHVSTRESVELVRRARACGLAVSCETAPHYLLLCDEDLQEEGRFKMNPPLRSRADRDALREGVLDGTIEVIATDHAPHTAEEKSRGLAGSAMGIVGLECAFPLLYTYLVKPGMLTLERLVELMSLNPRRIFGLGGGLQAGQPADFTVMDLGAEYEIDPAAFLSMGHATPFAGWRVGGRTMLTVVDGREAYRDPAFGR
ncbi:MAG TPA: dihydroorotase [Candidatus Alistipes stercorigallinarum]|uniref:dihydroorotase n=1 Tax=uncultured Alistipes sp. TaxID=538949 RepID=UPI001F9202DE|nr:dihydroorotase [uncultured Alistipes sp.]HJC16662.1 dihydroorotase [Candidatus Alistipes stercorigallinarum]